jgi:hypothetical protein
LSRQNTDEDHLSPKSFRHPAVLDKTTSSVGRSKDARKIINYAGEILREQTYGNFSLEATRKKEQG